MDTEERKTISYWGNLQLDDAQKVVLADCIAELARRDRVGESMPIEEWQVFVPEMMSRAGCPLSE